MHRAPGRTRMVSARHGEPGPRKVSSGEPPGATSVWLKDRTRRPLQDRSVLDDGALVDLVAAVEAVCLGAQGVGPVVARDDDVIELPER